MFRTIPVEDPRQRNRAIRAASLLAVFGPLAIIVLPAIIADGLVFFFKSDHATFEATRSALLFAYYFFFLTLPSVALAWPIARAALIRGLAGFMAAMLAAICVCAILFLLISVVEGDMTTDVAFILPFVLFGAIWGAIYWLGAWAFVPESVQPRAQK